MKNALWKVWSLNKAPGYTPRTYAVGALKRTLVALADRGLLRRGGKAKAENAAYLITAAGKKLARELFG
jgi:hypothetical protein